MTEELRVPHQTTLRLMLQSFHMLTLQLSMKPLSQCPKTLIMRKEKVVAMTKQGSKIKMTTKITKNMQSTVADSSMGIPSKREPLMNQHLTSMRHTPSFPSATTK